MDTLRELASNIKPKHVAVILVLLFAFIGFSVARCTAVHSRDLTDEPDGSALAVEDGAQDGDVSPERSEPTDAGLSDEQRQLVESYDEATQAFVQLLTASTWVSKEDQAALSFTGTCFTEASGAQGGTSEHAYAVSAYEKTEGAESGANGESATIVTHSAAILTDDGTRLLTLRQVTSGSSQYGTTWTISSNAFEYSDSYTAAEAAESLSVSGMSSSFGSLIDGQTAELTQALSDFCSKYYPTATKAEWMKMATIDWEASTVSTSFELDNDAKTSLTAVYNMQSKKFSIE